MMMKQWVRTKKNKIIKGLNNNLDEIIDKSKSLKEQTESLEKLEDLLQYWPCNDYDDKELKPKYFKIQLAGMSNEIGKKLFEQIFDDALVKLYFSEDQLDLVWASIEKM